MDMKQIEALYELSPLQQGLLFHTLYDTGAGMYVEQLNCTLQGDLDLGAFQRAWRYVADRHSVLRTSFHWEELAKPLQVVQRQVELAWQLEDWRALPPAEQFARLAAYLTADRARGFDVSTAPLIRLALFRMAADAYSFVWSHHHILLDGWSVSLVLNEILASYAAFAHGQQLQLPHPRPYRDYIAWLQRQDLAQAETFWCRSLAGFSALTPLGIDRPIGSAGGGMERYAERHLWVPVPATTALQDFARRQGLTLNTLVSGAWALLLSRYSGAEDVLFGATVAGRPPDLAGVETMVGLFINTLPVRVRVDAALDARTWLQQLQELQLDLRQYEYSPLVQVQGWSDIPRGMSMFESLLVFENYPADSAVQEQGDRPGLVVRDVRAVEQTNYPLTVVAAPDQALMLQIAYECARFDAATVARMLAHMRALMEQLAARPDQWLAEVSLLTRAERQQLLVEWNNTATGVRGQGSGVRSDRTASELLTSDSWCLHQLLEAQTARTPDALAVVYGQEQLTYRALDAHANQLAHHLRALGVGPEVPVGLCVDRSITALVGILAILKAGGVFVPFDPTYPTARLEYMLVDSATSLLLAHAATLTGIVAMTAARPLRAIVCLDRAQRPPDLPADVAFSNAAALAGQPDERCTPVNRAEDTAYMMYTSGSTGQPKGVPIRHGNAVPFFLWYQDYFGFRSDDRIIQYHSLSFDFSTWEIFEALHAGACLHMVSTAVARDVGALADYLSGARITVLNMTPSQFGALNDYVQQFRPAALRAVRILVLGGEMLPPALVRRAAAITPPGCRLFNEYGPTETTISSSIFEISAGALARYGDMPSMPVGRPIGNTQLHVLDAGLRPVPIGLPGELYIGGIGLALGYFARPELTAERFVPNPFLDERQGDKETRRQGDKEPRDAAEPQSAICNLQSAIGTRLYKTGDLARYLPDGGIEILGRRDQQVKLRGFRIELAEIETVLGQHSDVREAAVIVREDAPSDRRLVAYVVQWSEVRDQGSGDAPAEHLIPDPRTLIPDLRAFLAERLPDYMIPAAFVPLAALPLSLNGKLDRRALPAPDSIRPAVDTFVAPRTAIEEVLAGIWADVLRLDQVAVHDNFFMLGGHSLLATQVISRVRAAFAVELPLRSLFESPTVAALAECIVAARADAPQGAGLPLRPVARGATVPLSFAQQRLWFLDQLRPESTAYNLPTAVRLVGSLDTPALWRSLGAIIQRHEVLRTTFAMAGGQPVQVIAPARRDTTTAPLLPLLDLRALAGQVREQLARRLATEDAQRPFDLTRGPLLRAHLLRLAEQEHMALLNMHHIIADGWSVGVFIQELATLYAAYAAGQAVRLPELPVQYADYALWQRQWLQEDVLERQMSYWKRQLADLPVLQLPTDRPRPAVGTYQGKTRSFMLPRALAVELTALNRQAGVTSFMTLLATFQVLLARYTGQDDIVVGTPIAGRTRAEVEPLIGFFANTLVLRTSLAGRPTFQDVLQRVREVCLEAYAHQDLPFDLLVEALHPARDLSYTPLFQVMFALQNAPMTALELPNLTLQMVGIERGTTQFDLNLALIETEHGLIGEIQYSSDLFDEAMIARLQGHFQTLLTGVVAESERSVWALPLLTAAERQQLSVGWNASQADYPADRRVHELVEDQAERAPDVVALVFTGEHLTYRALNRRANQLARQLRAAGVGPETRVGLCMERSNEMIIGILGVLKAGGAYVPIDPEYPGDRISFMLADARAPVLLTQRRLSRALPAQPAQVIAIDAAWESISRLSLENLGGDGGAENIVYVIYTSGSTGTPKGVMVKNGGLVNLCFGLRACFDDDRVRNIALITSISFDISINQIFPTLLFGRTLHIIPDAVKYSSRAFVQYLVSRQIQLIDAVPSYLNGVLTDIQPARVANALRYILIGGEKLEKQLLRKVFDQLGQRVVLVNIYGLTEITDINSLARIGAADLERPITIGRPLNNTRIYILDPHGDLQPVGVTGELCIAGAGLSRGYLNRPALTAEKFVPNPFAVVSSQQSAVGCRLPAGELMCRTGDLGRRLPDGMIELFGRIDHQVKVRGFRIEVGEIEAALAGHPAVRETVVVMHEDRSGDQRLAAYVVPHQGSGIRDQESVEAPVERLTPVRVDRDPPRPLIPELRAFLKERLPDYMLPSAFIMLDALPKTPNGKIDRNALPAPEPGRATAAEAYVAPRTPLEELLAQLWADVLHLEQVGIQDHFFELGGHSLLATQVIARIRETCTVELPLRALFETPTIAALAPQIAAAQQAAAGLVYPPLGPVPRDAPPPLSFAQQRLWFLEQLMPGSALSNMPLAVRLIGPLDLAVLRASLDALVRRHEALRTRFPIVGEQPVQQIDPPASPQVGTWSEPLLLDLQALPTVARERVLPELANAEAHAPFDLARGPLLRTVLVRLTREEHALLLTLHHIIADGWSLGILVRDLMQIYIAGSTGQPAALPDLPIQYADYAAWQRGWLQGAPLQAELAYWKNQMATADGHGGPPILELPTDHPRPPALSPRGARQELRLDAGLHTGLRTLSQHAGVTLFMTLLAAWKLLLAQRSGQTDIVVGTDVAGRTQRATEDLIGCFVNQLVLRTNLAGNPSFAELLQRVRAVCLAAYTHQDAPFEQVVAALGGTRQSNRTPLFQVKIILQPVPVAVEQPNLTVQPLALQQTTAQFDLALSLHEGARGIDVMLDYSTDLFEEATIQRMLEHYELLLRSVVAQPDARLDKLAAALARAGRQQQIEKERSYRDRRLEKLNKITRKVSTE